jgi:hypothetical protein
MFPPGVESFGIGRHFTCGRIATKVVSIASVLQKLIPSENNGGHYRNSDKSGYSTSIGAFHASMYRASPLLGATHLSNNGLALYQAAVEGTSHRQILGTFLSAPVTSEVSSYYASS